MARKTAASKSRTTKRSSTARTSSPRKNTSARKKPAPSKKPAPRKPPAARKPARKKTAQQIVAETMPGVEVMQTAAQDARRTKPVPPETTGLALSELRKKYLGQDAAQAEAEAAAADAVAAEQAAVQAVRVREKRPSADPADEPGERTVIVSEDTGIVGYQG